MLRLVSFERLSQICTDDAMRGIKSHVRWQITAAVIFDTTYFVSLKHDDWLSSNCTKQFDCDYSSRVIFFESETEALQFFLTWQ